VRDGTRPTTGAAYTDGSGMFVPSGERLERGSGITGERLVRADVCVIGTGAGGAPAAKELAEGGMTSSCWRRASAEARTSSPRARVT
jgi:hypothetical protein